MPFGCGLIIFLVGIVTFELLITLIFKHDLFIDSAEYDKMELYSDSHSSNLDSMCHYLDLCSKQEDKENFNFWKASLIQLMVTDVAVIQGYAKDEFRGSLLLGCILNEQEFLNRCNTLIQQTESWGFKSKLIEMPFEYFAKKYMIQKIKYFRGRFKVSNGDYFGAISDFNEILEDKFIADSEIEGEAYLELGRAYLRLNNQSKACENWSAGVNYSNVGNTCLELIQENCNYQK